MSDEPNSKRNETLSRKPWQPPLVIVAEDTLGASRITNEFPTDNHTAATIITGQS
jgi:hypothetical protein